MSAFLAVFLRMSVLVRFLAFLLFMHFEAKIMSVFSRERSVNTQEKASMPIRRETHVRQVGKKKLRTSGSSSKNCYEQKKVPSEDPGILSPGCPKDGTRNPKI